MQMVNHGITTGGLFLCVGVIYERTHSRQIADNVGLTTPMPRYATLLVIFALSSLGLPGTNSFVGEFMVLAGTFIWSKLATALASLGIILAAAYMLWMIQRVAFGLPSPHVLPALRDLDRREMATLIPLVVLVFLIGIFPNPILTRMHASVNQVLARTSALAPATAVNPDDQLLPAPTDGGSLAMETPRP
jgi:NADH-quinone oxidoreductase subunit M